MKTDFYKKLFGGILIFLFCAAIEIHAQNRGGGGGGGFGGFGGFGGGNGNLTRGGTAVPPAANTITTARWATRSFPWIR